MRYSLELDDPTPLLESLADAAGVDSARAAASHPNCIYAHAKRTAGRRRWYGALAKFAGFGLLPTGVWFYAHQHIAYGGLLGQYYLEGPGPYLTTFTISWGLASVYLLLYASAWRAAAEAVCWLAAWFAPGRAAALRRVSEIACALVYYGGVPVLIAVPFVR